MYKVTQLASHKVKTMYTVWLSWLARFLGLKKLHLRACRDSLDIGLDLEEILGNNSNLYVIHTGKPRLTEVKYLTQKSHKKCQVQKQNPGFYIQLE